MSFLELAKRLLVEMDSDVPETAAGPESAGAAPIAAPCASPSRPPASVARPHTWRTEIEAWPLAARMRWSQAAHAIETLESRSRDEADWLAYLLLRAELNTPPAGPWILSGGSGLALVVAAPPPWPDIVHRGIALVANLNNAFESGDHEEATALIDGLNVVVAELRAAGVKAWVTPS